MEAPFKIGQRVVCIYTKWHTEIFTTPKYKETYTIRDVEWDDVSFGWYAKLVEIINPLALILGGEATFECRGFVPIDEYPDMTKEIAESFKDVKETPDKILIPQIVKN